MNAVLALTLTAVLQDVAPVADAELAAPIEEHTLANGVRVTVAHAETATKQAFLTLLPMGLLSDDPGRAQWSHLAEHVMLRAHRPDDLGFEIDGTSINGETTALFLRMESFAPVEDWRVAQQRHATWLATGDLDGEGLDVMLEREVMRVLQEIDGTAASGFTHKWAVAAWNQVVRHGAGDVRLRGDVQDATVDGVLDYVRQRVAMGPGVHLVTVGPVDPAELLPALEEDFGRVPGGEWIHPAATLETSRLHAPVQLQATWDLPVRHYLEWYPMPDRYARDRIGADAVALMLNVRLTQHGSLPGLGAQAMAQADIITPEGRWLLISASLAPDSDFDRVQAEIDSVLANLTPTPDVTMMLGNMVAQLTGWPDFAALRDQFAGHPQLDFIEAQQMLFQVYAMENMGLDREQLEAYGAFDRQAFEDFADEVLVTERRSTLLLTPAGS